MRCKLSWNDSLLSPRRHGHSNKQRNTYLWYTGSPSISTRLLSPQLLPAASRDKATVWLALELCGESLTSRYYFGRQRSHGSGLTGQRLGSPHVANESLSGYVVQLLCGVIISHVSQDTSSTQRPAIEFRRRIWPYLANVYDQAVNIYDYHIQIKKYARVVQGITWLLYLKLTKLDTCT